MTSNDTFVPVRALVQAWAALAREGVAAGRPARLNVFLECDGWVADRIRSEVDFVKYVREREQADVRITVVPDETTGASRQYSLRFVGAGRFRHIEAGARLHLERQHSTRPRRQDPGDRRRLRPSRRRRSRVPVRAESSVQRGSSVALDLESARTGYFPAL